MPENKYGFPITILGDAVDVFQQHIRRAYLQSLPQGIEPLFQPVYRRRVCDGLHRLHALNNSVRKENLERIARADKLRRRRLKFGF
jgi:hypothetical protein